MLSVVPATSTETISTPPIRLHGLDTLRDLAMVLVVLVHAGIPYMTYPLPHLVWPARDPHPSWAVDAMTWCTECFLMSLFFVLAGFFSEGMLIVQGERSFLAGRTKRLLFTQFAASLVILPICLCIWLLGWVADGLVTLQEIMNRRVPPQFKTDLYGVAHIWFLQNLYIYCLILCGVSWLAKRIRRPEVAETDSRQRAFRGLDRVLVSVWKPLLPAIPSALILYWDPRIVLGFYQAFFPVISKLIYFAIYFFVGALLYRQRESMRLHARYGKTYLVIAGLLFAAALPLIHEHTTTALTGWRLALLAGLLALFAWFTTFGLLAIFLRTKLGGNPVTQYLAEASFWVYLIHLPFVVLTQISIARWPVPSVGKFVLAAATGLAMALMTYEVFVRRTWLGEFLNGRRRTRVPASAHPQPAGVHCARPAIETDGITRSDQHIDHWIALDG